MRKHKPFLLFGMFFFLFFSFSTTAYAKPRIDVVKHGGWVDLSDEDMQDTIVALVEQIAKEEQLPYVPEVSCFDWPENAMLAYNTLITKTICVNLSYFRNSTEADFPGTMSNIYL